MRILLYLFILTCFSSTAFADKDRISIEIWQKDFSSKRLDRTYKLDETEPAEPRLLLYEKKEIVKSRKIKVVDAEAIKALTLKTILKLDEYKNSGHRPCTIIMEVKHLQDKQMISFCHDQLGATLQLSRLLELMQP